MNRQEVMNLKLDEIELILRDYSVNQNAGLGVLNGSVGISLFHFYYGRLKNNSRNISIGSDILSKCVDNINQGFEIPSFCDGLAGFGWAVDHLVQESFVDLDSDKLLSDLDGYLYLRMIRNLEANDYDFLHGALGQAFYFLNRYRNTKSKDLKNKYFEYLKTFLVRLELISESNLNIYKWQYQRETIDKNLKYNLGLSHGMSSILNFLGRLFQHTEFKSLVEPMINGTARFILTYKRSNPVDSLFPDWVGENFSQKNHSRLAWCYGDLGIGLSLWNVSKQTGNNEVKKISLEILDHSANRRNFNNTKVNDAGICHGSFGNSKIFQYMFKETGKNNYREAADFWIDDGLGKAIHDEGFAGFQQWAGENYKWVNSNYFLGGISGIGMCIIDYLNTNQRNLWDECLMIN